MNSSSGDFWYVKLTDGDVHRVTLDQLDEAFQAGHIDANTMVLAGGSSEWTRLGAIAGMDDDGSSSESAAAEDEPPAEYIPQRPVPHYVQQPRPVAMAPVAMAAAPVRPVAPQPHVAAPSPYAPRPVIPPVVAPSIRPGMPNTLRPISVDFGADDPDLMPRRRGGAAKWVGALVAIAAIGGVGAFAVTTRPPWAQPLLNRLGYHAQTEAMAAAVALPPPAPAPAPEPAPAPPPPPVAAAPAPAPPGAESPLNPHFNDNNSQLTDDQKARLAAADKQHAKGGGAHKGGGGHAPPSRGSSSKGKSSTFTTTGSKYDPLNSSI